MSKLSFRDLQQLSAFLDGQLDRKHQSRLEARLKAEPELVAALTELRQVKTLLRKTPQHRAPRNFTLTRKMAGIRPPVPRVVPALSWASAVAALLFLFTLGINVLGSNFGASTSKALNFSGQGAAPMVAATAAPATMAPATQAPATVAPAIQAPPFPATAAPVATQAPLPTESAPNGLAPSITSAETATATAGVVTDLYGIRSVSPPQAATSRPAKPFPWLYLWLGLALLLILLALLIRWISARLFARRLRSK